MIPMMNIIAWGRVVPWVDLRQVEQDLIISRAIIDLFSDPFLHEQLRFRGGTALDKLYFPEPMRFSEDIDLVRTTSGPVGPILARLRDVLEPWLGHAAFEPKPGCSEAAIQSAGGRYQHRHQPIRLKVEINTREIDAYDPPARSSFE